MARHANAHWNLPDELTTWDMVAVATLMDIRDRLDRIVTNTSVLNCSNAREIPKLLRKIAANTDRFKCQEHPRYKAILPPRTDCKDCRRMFRRRHP